MYFRGWVYIDIKLVLAHFYPFKTNPQIENPIALTFVKILSLPKPPLKNIENPRRKSILQVFYSISCLSIN